MTNVLSPVVLVGRWFVEIEAIVSTSTGCGRVPVVVVMTELPVRGL